MSAIAAVSSLITTAAAYGVKAVNFDVVISAYGGGGGGGSTDNGATLTAEESGPGGNGAYVEVQLSGLPATAKFLVYGGGGGLGGGFISQYPDGQGGTGGAASIVVLESTDGTQFVPILVAGGGGGGGGAGGGAIANATPGAPGAAVFTSGANAGQTASVQDSNGVNHGSGGDAAGGGTHARGGTAPSPRGMSGSAPGTTRTTVNGIAIAQNGGGGAGRNNVSLATTSNGNLGGDNGSPWGGDGGPSFIAINSTNEGYGGGGGGGWFGGSGGGAAVNSGESGSGGGGGSSYVNAGTFVMDGCTVTVTVRASAAGARRTYVSSGTVHTAVNNTTADYWGTTGVAVGRGGAGKTAAGAVGGNGNQGAVRMGRLGSSARFNNKGAGASAPIVVEDITMT